MLTRENLKGVWAAIPTPWDGKGNFDEITFRENIARLCEAEIHGIYTTGSTGEFYALDFEEFKIMVDAFIEEIKNEKVLTQVGCTSINTKNSIKMIKYVEEKGIDGVQVAFPFWMKLRNEECIKYFKDISRACPNIGIVHYNTIRSKRFLRGRDYKRLIEEIPNLVGTKFGSTNFAEWMELMIEAPELRHFPTEYFFVPAMMTGGKGMYSSLANLNPKKMVDWYNMCVREQWQEALRIQRRVNELFIEVLLPLVEAGYPDPVIDKATLEISGFLRGNRKTRKPYLPLSDEKADKLSKILQEKYSEFLWSE